MIRKFTAFFLSFVILLSAFAFSFSSAAVAPLGLVQAALASYVASTGYKLWVDNGTGSDVLTLISQLYSEFEEAQNNNVMTMLELGSYVGYDNSGNIVISETAADIFQNFSEWILSHYDVTPGSPSHTTVVASLGSDIYDFGNGVHARRFPLNTRFNQYYVGDLVLAYSNDWDFVLGGQASGYVYAYIYENGTIRNLCFLSSNSIGTSYLFACQKSGGIAGAWYGISCGPTYWSYWTPPTGHTLTNLPVCSYYDTSPVVASPTALPGSPGLAVSLAQDIADKAAALTPDKSLVIDVGAAAGSTADDIIDAVIEGYVPDTGTIPVTDVVVDTVVIDTPVQPYPDIDSLGLPELGLALTTRFPFSIPWDIGAIYSSLSHQAIAPTVTFDLIPASVLQRWHVSANTSITIDLTDSKYTVLLAIIHWACIVGFCLGLATLTKRYIWTTGG